VLLEDDPEDHDLFLAALNELGVHNPLIWFKTCEEAYRYLLTTEDQPFIIFSDINLPVQSGLDFKLSVDQDEKLRRKSIPFVFLSTNASQEEVNEAYTRMTVQGFFKKPSDYTRLKEELAVILAYWKQCRHPNIDKFD